MSAIEVKEGESAVTEYAIPKAIAEGWVAFIKSENMNWMSCSPIVPVGTINDLARHPWPLHKSKQDAIDAATTLLPNGGTVKVFKVTL
jgi:hypothetical protein